MGPVLLLSCSTLYCITPRELISPCIAPSIPKTVWTLAFAAFFPSTTPSFLAPSFPSEVGTGLSLSVPMGIVGVGACMRAHPGYYSSRSLQCSLAAEGRVSGALVGIP
jgi:hypothetical protein